MLTANRVAREFGARIFGHQFMIPLPHFRKWSAGETITSIGETDTIRNFLFNTTMGRCPVSGVRPVSRRPDPELRRALLQRVNRSCSTGRPDRVKTNVQFCTNGLGVVRQLGNDDVLPRYFYPRDFASLGAMRSATSVWVSLAATRAAMSFRARSNSGANA